MLKSPRLRWFFFLLVLLIAGLVIRKVAKCHEVRVSVVRKTSLTADLSATGFVEAEEVTVTSKVTGRVVAVKADEGDTVRRGAVLLAIEQRELNAQERAAVAGQSAAASHAAAASLETAAARGELPAQVQQAQAALAEAEAQLVRIKRGARPEELRESRALLQQTREGVALARAQLATAESVLAQQQKLSQAQVRESEAALAAAKAVDEQVRTGPRPQEIAQVEAALREARSRRALAEKDYQRISSLHASGAVSRQQLDQVESALAVSREAETQAQERLNLAKTGARQEERETSKAQVEAANARVAGARAAAEQVQVRQREVDAAKTQVAQAESALWAAQARDDVVVRGARKEDRDAARARASQARAALQQAQASLARVGARREESRAATSQAMQAAAQTELAQIQRDEALIRSPIDGIVARRLVDVGELVIPSTPVLPGSELLKLVDVRKRWVIAEVDAGDIGKVSVGQEVEVTAEAYPGRVFPGQIVRIGATAEPKPGGRTRARIVRVKVSLSSPAPELKPGLEVDLHSHATLSGASLVIPNDAVLNDGDSRDYVFIVQNDRVARRTVRTGRRNDLTTEVLSGLREGDEVVVRGKEGLRDRMRVKVMNR